MSNKSNIIKEKKNLKLISGYIENNELFFSAWNARGFFSYNFNDKKVCFLSLLPEISDQCNYGHLYSVDEEVYLSPCHGDSIAVIKKGDWKDVSLFPVDSSLMGVKNTRCGNVFRTNNYLYFRPYTSHVVTEFDIESKKIRYYGDYFEEVSRQNTVGPQYLFMGNAFVNGTMYFVCQNTNLLIAFDTKNKKSEIYGLDEVSDGLQTVINTTNGLRILTNGGRMIEYNVADDGKIIYAQQILDGVGEICFLNGKIWVLQHNFESILIIDEKTGEIKTVYNSNKIKNIGSGSFTVISDQLFYLPDNDSGIYMISQDNYEICKIELEVAGEDYYNFLSASIRDDMEKKGITSEDDKNILNVFINEISDLN